MAALGEAAFLLRDISARPGRHGSSDDPFVGAAPTGASAHFDQTGSVSVIPASFGKLRSGNPGAAARRVPLEPAPEFAEGREDDRKARTKLGRWTRRKPIPRVILVDYGQNRWPARPKTNLHDSRQTAVRAHPDKNERQVEV